MNSVNFVYSFHSVQFNKIIKIISDSDFLSKRSKLIFDLLFNDKIVTETKGGLVSSKSICTFKKSNITNFFMVHPDFVIPKEFLEFPNLYTIYQEYQCNVNQYYRFGPSQRSVCMVFGTEEEFNINNIEFVETWTNEFGQPHREDGYASIHIRAGNVVGMSSIIRGQFQDFNGRPASVIKGSFEEIKEDYGKGIDNLHQLISGKIHILSNRDGLKARSVIIDNRQITFSFTYNPEDDIVFQITDNPGPGRRITVQEVFNMIEDFGNVNSEGNDLSDIFIRDYIMNLVQE